MNDNPYTGNSDAVVFPAKGDFIARAADTFATILYSKRRCAG